MTPAEYLIAARVPLTVTDGDYGPWRIRHQQMALALDRPLGHAAPLGRRADPLRPFLATAPSRTITVLERREVHFPDVVMEDSDRELQRHLPIWLAAHGAVLKTGLGLGCVVRGLLAKPEVARVDVIEIDPIIVALIEPTLPVDPRLHIHIGDALTIDLFGEWDFAWHDIWCPRNDGLDLLHARLIDRFRRHARVQGAWAMPRWFQRRMPMKLLGSPRFRSHA